MKPIEPMELLTLVSEITDKAVTTNDPAYRSLVTAAVKEADDGVPAYLATFRYIHRNLSRLSSQSKNETS